MHDDRLALVHKLTADTTFVGNIARIIIYLEETNVDSDTTLLYDK
jgi:hypothetical protein